MAKRERGPDVAPREPPDEPEDDSGVASDAHRIASRMWSKYLRAEL